MRRLLLLVSAIVLVDTSFYAALTPLLPYYADQEHLSKASAGVLAGSYAAGTFLAAIPAGWLAVRLGPRALVVAGLGCLSVTSVTFGLAHSIVLLDLARFAQGIGGALSWTGAMGWLSGAAPPDRRGVLMGTAMGAATAGALLGPVVGAVARGIGTGVTFGAIAVVALVMLALVLAYPARERIVSAQAGSLRIALRQPAIARGLWIVCCASLLFGAVNVLLPLRLDAAGASAAVIALVWLLSAGFETVVNPIAGRIADRDGWRKPARFGLVTGAVTALLCSFPEAIAPLAIVGVASGPFIGTLWTPALVLLGKGSDDAGFDHTYAYALMNLAWAGAQTVAAAGGGALAHATSDFVPLAIVASVALVTAAVGLRVRPRAAIAQA